VSPSHAVPDPREAAWAAGTYPRPLSEGRSNNMRANRRTNTKPEIALRSALHRLGKRFRKDHRIEGGGVRVKADLVFTRQRLAVFVDGCFWHACPQHGRKPTTNEWYWDPKLQRNRERDERVTSELTDAGWTVLRVWEHVPVEEAVAQVLDRLDTSRITSTGPATPRRRGRR
jgi:DNA mismatch endonuclease (patch repair protein)